MYTVQYMNTSTQYNTRTHVHCTIDRITKIVHKEWNFRGSSNGLGLCHKLKFSNPYIFAISWRKPFTFQTLIICFNRIHSIKYQRSTIYTTIRKSEFVAQTQFLYSYFATIIGFHASCKLISSLDKLLYIYKH